MPEPLFYKVAGLKTCNIIKKKTLAQVLSCECCEISKNTFFLEHPWWLLLKCIWNALLKMTLLKVATLDVFCKKVVLKNFKNFTGKHLCRCPFNKKRLQHRFFPVKFARFLRTPIFKNICERLLLGVLEANFSTKKELDDWCFLVTFSKCSENFS